MPADYTAIHALQNALNPEIQLNATQTEPPTPGQTGFESVVLARCFHILGITKAPELPQKLTHQIRPAFIKGIKITQIGEIIPDVVNILMPHIATHALEQKTITMAAVQITAAILSLMQANPEFEKATEAIHKMTATHDFNPEQTECFKSTTPMPPAFKIWLQQPQSVIQSGDSRTDLLLNALRRRQNNDHEWYSTWLRNTVDVCALDSEIEKFETFWRIEAWNHAGSPEHALEILYQLMSVGTPEPQYWLQMAQLCIQTHRYGEAEHALDQIHQAIITSKTTIKPQIYDHLIQELRKSLARHALSQAKASREIEEPLLELAMQHGDPQTIAESALCIYDAQISHDIPMLEALKKHEKARMLFIETLVERRDTDHLDALYALCAKLQKDLPDAPEYLLLEAASQIDNPHIAAQTLTRALRKLPKSHPLYWCAVDLWIEIMTSQGAMDEAIYGIVEAFTDPHPRASRALMFLMARMPRSALGMMQTIMIENLGKDAAIQAFERIKQGNANREIPVQETSESLPDALEQSLWFLPMAWQVQYHAARLNPPPTLEEQAKAARRESVLMARGIISKKCDPAPEPAQWEHRNFGKASDAFEI